MNIKARLTYMPTTFVAHCVKTARSYSELYNKALHYSLQTILDFNVWLITDINNTCPIIKRHHLLYVSVSSRLSLSV